MPHLVADLVSPPVRLHQLLTGWQFGDPYARVAFAFQALAVVLYLWGVVRLQRKGRRWSPARTGSFVAGVLVLTIAIVSGLASYDDQDFTVHVGQHLAIMMVAPPLLALGAPVTLTLQAAHRRFQTGLIRFLHSPVIQALITPAVAGVLYYGAMYVDLLTPYYGFSLEHGLVHNLTHVLMFTFGCLFWWPMIGGDRLPTEPSFRTKFVAMAAGTVLEVALGIALLVRSTTIAPQHTLADTRAGGLVFLIGSLLVSVLASALMTAQWMAKRSRSSARAQAAIRAPVGAAAPIASEEG